MNNWELPLVLFTVLSQAAVGAIIFSAVLEPQVAAEHVNTRKALRKAGAWAFPLLLVSLVLSVFHLGQPLAAYRALRHLETSWLSREILFFGITTVLSGVYCYLCESPDQKQEVRTAFGYLAGLVGLIAVGSSAMVYALPSRALWSAGLNTAAFFGTVALLGGLGVAAYNRCMATEDGDRLVARVSGWAVVAGAVLTVVALAGTSFRVVANPAVMQSADLVSAGWFYAVQAALGLALPLVVAVALILRAKDLTARYLAFGLAFAVVGELAGRIAFYVSALGPSLWG
jgi:anaerobic dimethyl sulfoxide reductase subunit C (anchor subunit)